MCKNKIHQGKKNKSDLVKPGRDMTLGSELQSPSTFCSEESCPHYALACPEALLTRDPEREARSTSPALPEIPPPAASNELRSTHNSSTALLTLPVSLGKK